MPLDLSDIPIIDHHAHALLRRPPATAAEWLAFFTESRDPALVADHVPNTLFFRYAVKALAGLLGCEPTPEAVLNAYLEGTLAHSKYLMPGSNMVEFHDRPKSMDSKKSFEEKTKINKDL